MRLLCEIFVVGGLLYLGWEKPFNEWVGQKPAPPAVTVAPSIQPILRVAPIPATSTSIRDPNHRTVLDTPAPINNQPQPASSKPGSWLFDPNHRSPLDPPKPKQSTPH